MEAGMHTMATVCDFFIKRKDAMIQMQSGPQLVEACEQFMIALGHIEEENRADPVLSTEQEIDHKPLTQLVIQFREFMEEAKVGDLGILEAKTEELGLVARVAVSVEMAGGLVQ